MQCGILLGIHTGAFYVDHRCGLLLPTSVAWSASLSATVASLSPAKIAEPIEMPFGLRTWVGPRNHVLDGVNIRNGSGQF